MNKKFEYVDDNPGAYFGMLVENWENLNEDKKNLRNWIEKKVGKQMSNMKPTKVGYKHGRPYYVIDFTDGTSDDYFIDFDKKEIEKCESLKEDSEYKTLAKLSNGLEVISYPYGYAVSDGYAADRFVVRDGKYIFDDGRFHLSDKDKQKILSLINKGVIEESLKESYSKSDLYSALEYMYGFNKKEANDWIKKASDKMKQYVVDGWKGNAKKSALTDSLKEDKFVPQDKMSKKDKKELDSQKRNTWGNTNPVTRVQANKKAYDRKRDKKVVEESFDNDVNVLVNLLSDRYCDEDGIVTKDRYDSVYKYLGKNYSEKIRDAVMDNLVAEFGLPAERDKKVVDEDIENKDSEEYLGVDEVKRFVNAREKLLDISDSMTTDLRLGRISREDVLYYRNEIKEIYSFLNSLYFGR